MHLGWFASLIAEPNPEQLALGLKFTDLPPPPQTWQQISPLSTDRGEALERTPFRQNKHETAKNRGRNRKVSISHT